MLVINSSAMNGSRTSRAAYEDEERERDEYSNSYKINHTKTQLDHLL